ncbi:Inwardly rectifying K channel [Nesidiocoris tenuis]|uniref:Inwardly rectifying K channel n=1 Tax=Nesidiocoris tenuis TaxID=355587 RepID=A0ABN7B2T2_9HEMI|nr:Inwardly rectifying K channel [Nesidiocoris tenuis]
MDQSDAGSKIEDQDSCKIPIKNPPHRKISRINEPDSVSAKSFEGPRRKRFVTRDGKCALRKANRFKKPVVYYFTDIVSALLECRWRYLLFWYTALNMISWYLFGVLWWLIAYAHDDLFTSPLLDYRREPCVTEVRDMLSAFMFSVETQYTTGYGSRTPTTQCPEAVFLLCAQNIVGMLLQSSSLGVIFAKLARPKARTQAIKFSEKAVISMRDGLLCLMFRIADVRKSHLIACQVKGWLMKNHVSAEGDLLEHHRYRLSLDVDGGGDDPFMIWPVTVVHRIDESSPLYAVSAQELYASDFEIVVLLSSTIESTGQQAEVRCSYLPSDILWGHKFLSIFRRTARGAQVDYSQFDKTTEVDTALCSSRSLHDFRKMTSLRSHSIDESRAPNRTPKRFLSVSRQISQVSRDDRAEDAPLLLATVSNHSLYETPPTWEI